MSDWFEDLVIGAIESGERAAKKAIDSVLGDAEHKIKKVRKDVQKSTPVNNNIIDAEIIDEGK